ncbi:low affinity immunoglobulin epsilon Fc receptor-like [Saccostrea echinata]|uniref:low affinity immunoglobulin epsilon Fc receptor-like n=1 Tax=Saccostrea echinata TaxID=191078 RepID=UPI002A7F8F05|nr:low affinity immunoglobulin epsilon Fc receptor-like [Saccostrea echinata]
MSNVSVIFFLLVLVSFTFKQGNTAYVCQDGWASFGEDCYKFLNEMEFIHAVTICLDLGANVLEVQSSLEEKWIDLQCRIRDCLSGVWLGVSDLSQKGMFLSVSQARPPQYLNWGWGEPFNKNDGENCVALSKRKRAWDTTSCLNKYNIVCKKPMSFL